jgi:plastocyanin
MRRRAGLALAGVAVLAAIAAPAAMAAPASIQAGTPSPPAPDPNVFNPTSYLHDGGTVATMTYVAGGSHNVTATVPGPDSKPLFRSDTVGAGTVPVAGTQYLAIGSYAFFCSVHIGMNGTLNVNTGVPQPRPTALAKGGKGAKLAAVAKKGKLPVKFTVFNGGQATVAVLLGKKQIGATKNPVTKSGTVQVPLTAKGKAALAKKKKATLKLNTSLDFGSPSTAKVTLK